MTCPVCGKPCDDRWVIGSCIPCFEAEHGEPMEPRRRSLPVRIWRALVLAWSIWTPWWRVMPNADPMEAISLRTAWSVGVGIWMRGAK